MIPEAPLDSTETGLVQTGPVWFVVNAREARWPYAEGRGAVCPLGDEAEFPQVGVNLYVLAEGEAMGLYHWEANEEDFLSALVTVGATQDGAATRWRRSPQPAR